MKYHKIFSLGVLAAALLGCERDLETEGISRITYYPVMELAGEEEYVLPFGSDFTDPGASATEQGTPIEVSRSISGTYFYSSLGDIDTSKPDEYSISYSAVNKDGYSGTITRSVTILPPTGDLVNSLEGVYTMTVVRTPGGGPANADYTDNEYGYIVKVGENRYQLSDAIGGYYEFGRVYGPAYAATGGVIEFTGGTATQVTPAVVGSFGGNVNMSAISVDPGAKTITFKGSWPTGPYDFQVTLKQVEL